MKVHIRNHQTRPVSQATIRRIALAAMRAESCPEDTEVSIVLCGDRRIRTLNRVWRDVDTPTDVLSFSQIERTVGPEFPLAPTTLGDVVISMETAARQARDAGTSTEQEVRQLLVHGLLHLAGWDHRTTGELRQMLARQEEILSQA